MSNKKSGRVALAIGVWLVLSVVVFGSLIYVAYTSNSVEIVASEDGFSGDLGGADQIPAVDINYGRGTVVMPYSYGSGFYRSHILAVPF